MLRRDSPKDIKMRNLAVILDDSPLVDIQYGQVREYPVEPGPHTLRITNTVYSRSAAFDMPPAGRTEFEVANVVSGLGGCMFVVLGMGPYKVALREISGTPSEEP